MADGRRYPLTPIGYVFLFFYGLERRVLIDARQDLSANRDIPAITVEVRRLLALYGGHSSFRSYAGDFLDVLEAIASGGSDPRAAGPPTLNDDRWSVPVRVKLALGRFATTGEPVPGEWARAWAWYHPQIYPRTPQTRCPSEFERLFIMRYQQKTGRGMVVRPGKWPLRLSYRSASPGIGTTEITTSTPDVFENDGPRRTLSELTDSVTHELDAYSRWLGRNPEGRGLLAAAALMPVDLIDIQDGQVGQLRALVESRLAGGAIAIIEGADLITLWHTSKSATITKPEAVALAQLLDKLGIGIEPDIRFGAAMLSKGPAVLFRSGDHTMQAPSSTYRSAAFLMHLAVAVGQADGQVVPAEYAHMATHVQTALGMSSVEKARLQAHLRWLVATGVRVTAMKKRVEALSAEERRDIADFLLAVATADGIIHAAEVTTLMKIYSLFGFDPSTVPERLHHLHTKVAQSAWPPATEPVVVRSPAPTPTGFAIPVAPAPPNQQPGRLGDAERAPANTNISLDQAVIERKIAETARVVALLSTIFSEADTPQVDQKTTQPPATALGNAGVDSDIIAGLDPAHALMLRDLAFAPTWSRQRYEELANHHGLLPAGAIDILNEAALVATGELVIDGDHDLTINMDVLQEMLR